MASTSSRAKGAAPPAAKTGGGGCDDDARFREGDAHWMRVMATREWQWRLLNSLALHEMAQQERQACADLTSLGAQLEKLQQTQARLSVIVSHAAATRAQHQLVHAARPALSALCSRLSRMRVRPVADVVRDSRRAVVLPGSNEALMRCLHTFCQVAAQFESRAREQGLFSLAGVATLLTDVLNAAVMEASVVSDAAEAVLGAGVAAERQRSALICTAQVPLLREPHSLT
ncbi:hypothetical protein FGB62_11g023 [Gracilaria domingensis]|nr:hypothetical protein FGB62_11g023 [Gracilaria domingensis]